MSTYQQLLYHVVFSTKNRLPLLTRAVREPLFAYIAGICQQLGGFALIVNGYVDHVHLLVRIPARLCISDFIGKVKCNSSRQFNATSDQIRKLGWQRGYSVFSVSVSAKDRVYQYIEDQERHHQGVTFEQELLRLLEKHEVEFDTRYLFD